MSRPASSACTSSTLRFPHSISPRESKNSSLNSGRISLTQSLSGSYGVGCLFEASRLHVAADDGGVVVDDEILGDDVAEISM
jgi:hypothetical protein